MNPFRVLINLYVTQKLQKQSKRICTNHSLKLPKLATEDANILNAIFLEKCYGTYFPFFENVIIVDIGAHKGFFSLFAKHFSGPQSQIFALEPVRSNRQTIINTLHANNIESIVVLPYGIAKESKKVPISLSLSCNHSLFSSVIERSAGTKYNETEEVQLLTFADFKTQNGLSHIDFLKIDCEGTEYEIIESMSCEELQSIKVISMEIHDLRDQGIAPRVIIDKLQSAGFVIARYEPTPTEADVIAIMLVATNHHYGKCAK